MLICLKKEISTQKIYQEARREDFQLLCPLLEDQKSLFSMSQHQEWTHQQEDTFGNF